MKKLSCLLIICVLCGSAWSVPTSVYDFVIFSDGTLIIDGGYETEIGGHTLINGNIGSNQDLFMQGNPLPGYPAQLNGSAYAGRDLNFGQDLTVGSSKEPREVLANGVATIGGDTTIWGTLDAFSYTLGSGQWLQAGRRHPPVIRLGLSVCQRRQPSPPAVRIRQSIRSLTN